MNAHSFVNLAHGAALEQARSLWYAADYTACLNALERVTPSGAGVLLAAWASYRLRRYEDALAHLARGHSLLRHQWETHVEADALSCVLHELTGNTRESDIFCERVARNDLKHEIGAAWNMLALQAWLRDDLPLCLRRARFGEAAVDQNVRAYAVSLRSWTYSSRNDFIAQARLLEETLNLTLSAPTPDVGLAAETLRTLSHRCRELYLPKHFAAVCTATRDLAWTADVQVLRYNTLRHIGWTHALDGRYITGLQELAVARDIAPGPELAALSTLDAAWVSWVSGEKNAAQAHLRHALAVIDRVAWEQQTGAEVRGLLLAAELSAMIDGDGAKARALLSEYDRVKGQLSILFERRHNRSFEPIEDYARAVVLSAGGDRAFSRKLLKRAFAEFSGLGYEWRAARCALLMHESGCGDGWLAAAKEKAKNYPRSFTGARIQRIESENGTALLSRLTPKQREVLRELATGSPIDEVAATLHMSRNTVRVHVQRIYRVLGVRSRIELLQRTGRIAV